MASEHLKSDSHHVPDAWPDGVNLRGCHCCGLVQRVPPTVEGQVARCIRCHSVVYTPARTGRNSICMAVALSALILYPLGIFLPVLRLEQLGHVHAASIWDGTLTLLSSGQIVVGLVVLICSVVIPLLKLAGLFTLCARPPLPRRHTAAVYHAIELAGKWGMIDVLLVAVLVAVLKLGDLVNVYPGPGLVAFTGCVLLSLVATAFFDPHAIWEKSAQDSESESDSDADPAIDVANQATS